MATSRSLGSTSLTTSSPMDTVPAVGSSSPATIRSAVVLPHPEGPSRTRSSPSATSRWRSSTASTPSNALLTPAKLTRATPAPFPVRPVCPLNLEHGDARAGTHGHARYDVIN